MKNILVLPGDGIGPEVTLQARRVLDFLIQRAGLEISVQEGLLGGAALDARGTPAPQETLDAAVQADGVLLGAVGGPAWDRVSADLRPEAGLLSLRAHMGVYANLRPAVLYPELVAASSLRPEKVRGMDILIVRELTGGIYFGEPREYLAGPPRKALDTMVYDEEEIARIARIAFRTAEERRGILTSVDKANVLASSRLWREIVEEVAREFPKVQLTHLYVDNAAMQLAAAPGQFDVILAGNLFGDILSDLAGAVTGSIGILPSAAIGESGAGLYEPCHGSAPDIAGENRANPMAAVLSLAMMLRHSLGQPALAEQVGLAVRRVLQAGLRTADIARDADPIAGTEEAGDAIVQELDLLLRGAA